MSLVSIVDNTRTDKNTTHCYLELYDQIFSGKKVTAKNVLEVGIGNGGSVKLWRDYFTNATVYAVDTMSMNHIWWDLKFMDNIYLCASTNAYDETFVNETFVKLNTKLDVAVDDGPHTLKSIREFVRLYSPILAEDGILVIENVQSIDWIKQLTDETPADLQKYIKVYDLRDKKNRYDDILFTIQKTTT